MDQIAFDPADAKTALAQLPTSAAVFALYGAEAHAEPYIGRTPNLRGRLERLLQPSAQHPRRLQLAGRVRQIRWRLTGSEFESLLAQFSLLEKIYGPKALERMHLRASGVYSLPGQQRLSAHHGHPPAQPARGRLGLRAVSSHARRPSAMPKRRSSCFCCAAARTNCIPTRAIPVASTPR